MGKVKKLLAIVLTSFILCSTISYAATCAQAGCTEFVGPGQGDYCLLHVKAETPNSMQCLVVECSNYAQVGSNMCTYHIAKKAFEDEYGRNNGNNPLPNNTPAVPNNAVVSYEKLPQVEGFIKESNILTNVETGLQQSGVANTVYTVLVKVGIAAAFIVILIMGIKWIMASPQQRADLKQSFPPLILGVFLLFCGASVGRVIINFVEPIFKQDVGRALNQVQTGVSSIIYTVGLSLALIMILVNGVMWLVATPQKRAELKGRMWNMVIGIGLLIGATFILSFLGTFFENINI